MRKMCSCILRSWGAKSRLSVAQYPGHWISLAVVLPFAVVAAGTAALMSRLVKGWPSYPRPLA
jgi:hypothetical protein